jgi:hypothetical protein
MGDIDFLVISVTENSNKFQKLKFSKEKSIDNNVITLEGLPFNSSMKNWDVHLVLLEIS